MKKTDIRQFTKQFYRGNGGYFVLAMVQTVLATAAQLMISWLLQQIIDLITGANTAFTLSELAIMAVALLVIVIVAYMAAYWSKPKFITKAIGQYKDYAFEKLSHKGIGAFSGENSSLYISALSNDANTIENGYLSNMFLLIDNVATFIGALALMFWYNPLLAIISIGLTILPLAASILTGNLVAKAEKEVSDTNEDYMSTLRDSLTGFSVIKSFRAEVQICRIYMEKVSSPASPLGGPCQWETMTPKISPEPEMLPSALPTQLRRQVQLRRRWLLPRTQPATPGAQSSADRRKN